MINKSPGEGLAWPGRKRKEKMDGSIDGVFHVIGAAGCNISDSDAGVFVTTADSLVLPGPTVKYTHTG